jgi:EPS-associated MarR family transcriptional regulator
MNRQQKLQQETYYRVLAILEQEPGVSQRDLARRLEISLGGVNYSLKALIERGWLKVQNFQKSENKLGYAYLLTPEGVTKKTQLAVDFLRRKMAEYEALEAEIASLQRQLMANTSQEGSMTSKIDR